MYISRPTIKWPIFFRRMATLANGRIKNWSMEIHRIFFLDDGKWQNTFLEVKKCFPLNLNVWHKYFCLLQALPHHILQCILSLITVLLKWCFFLIWITSFTFNLSGDWKLFLTLCRWISSLLCETHHFSVSLCKNTSTCEKSIHSTLSATPSYLMWH